MKLLPYFFSVIDRLSLLFALFLVFWTVALTILHHICKKKETGNSAEDSSTLKHSLRIWRLLCLFPLPLAILHFIFYRFHGSLALTLSLYGTLYITPIFLALWQFLFRRKHSYRIAAVCANLCAVFGFLLFFFIRTSMFTIVNNFSSQSYTESFLSTIHAMQREYVLSEWKDIDYDALEKDIMPMVKEAEEKQDNIGYGIALITYAYRFYDGHVCLEAMDDNDTQTLCERLAGNDYGFSLITLDDGKTIAVLTDPDSEAYELGIEDGTIITKWNGSSIKDAVTDVACIYPELLTFPVAENEAYLKPIFLAGKGETEIAISFVDKNGEEKTATLQSRGSYQKRLELALSRFYHTNIEDENFSCKMLTENCGYLRINAEEYEILSDIMASQKGEYPEITEMLDEKLKKLRDSGMEKLIIDLRGNVGGSDFISPAVASLFSREEYLSNTIAKYKDGKYIPLNSGIYVTANGTYADIPTVVLVNAECCSSGDGLADNLSRLPNVTLMGITSSNGIAQTIGGYCFTTDSKYVIKYPTLMNLDENNDPRIDTKADRINRVPLKEHISLTKESALTIFSGEGDYELDYAIDYLAAQTGQSGT